MSFIPEIYEKRHEFYLNFSNEFFPKDFWDKVLDDNNAACGTLCAFYTMVEGRCNTSKEETYEIVFNSLKKKCLEKETFENFSQILKKNLNKLGKKSILPFFNQDLKKAFKSFETLYMMYESEMQKKGEI